MTLSFFPARGEIENIFLLDMRDRKGRKALGYESFKAYGEKELGIEELRLKLIGLAAFLSDEEPIQDADTVKRWMALAGMVRA